MGLALVLINLVFINNAYSAACKGPHKNDPGCVSAAAPAPPITVNRIWADWLNEMIFVEGTNFSGSTTVTIAGTPVPINAQTPTQLEIAFFTLPKGNHNSVLSDAPSASSDSLSFYAKSNLVDPTQSGCPCATDWTNILTSAGLWAKNVTCYELIPGGPGNPEDISGTVLSNPTDPTVYPQYPIGAAFTADPNESVCQLTEVNESSGIPTATDLVKIRLNRQQQNDCRTILENNICNTIIQVP